jgi:hypothetical protein
MIQVSLGLPCYHTIWERQQSPGMLGLQDINSHWYYSQGVQTGLLSRHMLLNPRIVKGKGRPKGSKAKKKGNTESSTRREPSLFEYTTIELPPSTAPAQL